ncbi:MAG: 30S ribosomal protein S3 [Candidatus Woesearchaeota archaeon]
MIERQFITQKKKEFEIEQFITNSLKRVGLSHLRIQRTPLGEKIILYTSKPGLVVGRAGQNIKNLTEQLKRKFKLENPQIEIAEVEDINLNPNIVAERIATTLERYGSKRFKAIIHKALEDIMNAGALGAEIIVSGKVPSDRAKSWRVSAGYLRKCGDIAITKIRKAKTQAELKTGVIGIKVNITPPDPSLLDKIELREKTEGQKQGEEKVQKQETTVELEENESVANAEHTEHAESKAESKGEKIFEKSEKKPKKGKPLQEKKQGKRSPTNEQSEK